MRGIENFLLVFVGKNAEHHGEQDSAHHAHTDTRKEKSFETLRDHAVDQLLEWFVANPQKNAASQCENLTVIQEP